MNPFSLIFLEILMSLLTGRTKMSATAVHDDSFDGRLALITWQSSPPKYGDCVLHIAPCAIWFGV